MAAVILTLLGFLLPTQLGLHLWPSWSYVYGIRIDYLSPTIYLTDILLVGILILNLKQLFNFTYKHLITSLIVVLFVFVNTVFSINFPVTVIFWFRILLLANLVAWLAGQPLNRLNYLFLGLGAGIIIASSLALAEFASQKSINGIFYWLGERRYDITTPGISRLVLPNLLLLRPYSTFGHPNVLGGFSLVVFLLLSNIHHLKSNLLVRLAVPFAVLAIFLSFSKAAIFSFFLFSIFRIFHLRTKIVVIGTIIVSLTITLLPVIFTSLSFGRSLIDRNFLIYESIQIITHYPLLGAGLGNFIPAQASLDLGTQGSFIYLQPVHNIFLLLLSEIGILGIVLIGFLVSKLKINWNLKIKNWLFILSAVVLTGCLDHYWITLQQPHILLAVVLGLILNNDFY